MKKTAILILSILIAGLFVACNQEVTIDAQTYANMELGTFVLNGKNYATLQAAIDALSSKAVGDNDGVIYLTRDFSGPGAVIEGKNVKIDFGANKYTFTNVTATQGSTSGTFGLKIKGGSSVTLAGTKSMDLFDSTTGLTMVYVEGAGTSLAVEQAPQMSVADDQFVFWAADGATLTIGGETKVSGSIAATGSTSTPKVIITESAAIEVPEMKTENAAVLFNSSKATSITEISATSTTVVVTGTGTVGVDSVGTTSNLVVQNLSDNPVTVAGLPAVAADTKATVSDGETPVYDTADADAAEKIINNLPIFESGSGTEDDPYIIKTAAQLEMFRDSVNLGGKPYEDKFIKLDADITISGAWTPIGNSARTNENTETRVFSGTFDGNGKTITGLTNEGYTPTILRDNVEYVFGLFGVVNGATIKDLTLDDVSIETYKDSGIQGDCVGALVGYAVGSADISGCIVESGSVQGYSAVGGLIGRMYGANEASGTLKVEECKNYADVEGYEHVGGLIGWLDGSPRDGGTAGNTITLAECENHGDVKDSGNGTGVAGIAVFGLEPRAWTLTVTDCVNYGTISRTNAGNVAYVVCCDNGHDEYRTTKLVSNFKDNANFGEYSGPELERLIFVVSAMGVNGNGDWVYTGENYKEYNVATKYDGGTGTEEDPYQIASEATLKFFRDRVNSGHSGGYYVLTDDITLTEAWTPIGNGYRSSGSIVGNKFCGTFDGGNFTISGLTDGDNYTPANFKSGTTNDYSYGLFGTVEGAIIKNLKLKGVDIKSTNPSYTADEVGALVGFSTGSLTIDKVEVDSTSKISGENVGGIVGRVYGYSDNAAISITNCVNNATVTAKRVFASTPSNSYTSRAGGIVGYLNGSYGNTDTATVTIDSCVNNGVLTAYGNDPILGGIVSYGFNSKVDKYTFTKDVNNGNLVAPEAGDSFRIAKVFCETNLGWTSAKSGSTYDFTESSSGENVTVLVGSTPTEWTNMTNFVINQEWRNSTVEYDEPEMTGEKGK